MFFWRQEDICWLGGYGFFSRMSDATLPVRLQLPDGFPPYIASHPRSSPVAHLLSQALLTASGTDGPLPGLVAPFHDPGVQGGSVVSIGVPLSLPLGPCFDALHSSARDLPFVLACAAASPGLPGATGSASVAEAFASNLRSSTLLGLASEAAAAAALPPSRMQGALEQALHGSGGAASGGHPAAALALRLTPLRLLLRASQGGGEALAVVQEGLPPGTPLLAALAGALQRCSYLREAQGVILCEEGGTPGTHMAVLQGVEAACTPGLLAAAVGEVHAAASQPDGWLYVALRRAPGYGVLGL